MTVRTEEAGMDVYPIVDEGLGNTAWLVDLGDGRALVVDPSRDPTPYLALARRRRLRIGFAVETHLHADFVSGSRELAIRGAQLLAARAAGLAFAHRGLDRGEELDLGGLTLRAIATPGHAPEHLAVLLLDGAEPLVLFSGGALLVGGVARTDLVRPDLTRPLAHAAFHSARRLLELPDDLAVYPTHGAGSFCAASGGGQRTTTIGAERLGNPLLAAADEKEFTERLLRSLGSYPPYFLRLREVNRRGPRVADWRSLTLRRLPAHQVQEVAAGRGVLIDARPVTAFAAGHPAGALSIALRPQFGTWLGWLVPPDRPLVFVLDADQDRRELVRQCRTVGYEDLAAELDGGMAAWRAAGLPERRIELVDPGDLDEIGGSTLDVRQHDEVAAGHLPGAHTIELGSLTATTAAALPDGPLTVMCSHGQRAMTAASLLARSSRRDGALRVLLGGAEEWHAATGRPLARG
jgi:hydroxyacylglutathione hydrolase